jgi:outer membrane immunogenic protein
LKRLILSAALLTVASFPAAASDLVLPQPYSVYADPIAYDWSGFYVGLNAGVIWADATSSARSATETSGAGVFLPVGTFTSPPTTTSFSGVAAGAQAGYNIQTGNFVFGIEGDLQGVNASSTTSVASVVGGPSQESTLNISYLGTARLRVGYAVESLLFYGTGGAAIAGVDATNTLTAGPGSPTPGVTASGSDSGTVVGWTIGGGVEAGLGDSNWTVKAEYLYADFGSRTFNFGLTPTLSTTGTFDVNTHVLRAGINYRF